MYIGNYLALSLEDYKSVIFYQHVFSVKNYIGCFIPVLNIFILRQKT